MSDKNKEKKEITITKGKLAVIIILILLLIGGGVFVGLNWQKWTNDEPTTQTALPGNPDIDPGAEEWNGGKLPNKDETGGEKKGIQIPGYPSISLPADKTDVQIALLNPDGNRCYFTFEIVLDDTGETIYTSKMVPPGKAVTNITLSKPLPAGNYKATIKITTASVENLSPMNGANVKTELIVK